MLLKCFSNYNHQTDIPVTKQETVTKAAFILNMSPYITAALNTNSVYVCFRQSHGFRLV